MKNEASITKRELLIENGDMRAALSRIRTIADSALDDEELDGEDEDAGDDEPEDEQDE